MKNIIFDWSGVIKDAFGSHHWVVNRIFEKHGLVKLTLEELRDGWDEPYMIFFNKYLPNMTIEEEQIEYREGVMDKNYPKSKSYPGMMELIKKIKEMGCYVAVITADLKDSVTLEINEYGLEGVFDDIVIKAHDKTEALRELITKKSLKQSETVIVGDSNNEIGAAKIVGIESIAVTWGFAKESKLKSLNPNFLVTNLEELERLIWSKL